MKKLSLCFLLIGSVYCAFAQNPEARFIEVSGRVEIKETEASGWKTAAPGLPVKKNTVISTGFNSSAVISLGSSRLEVRPLTMLALEELVQRDGIEKAALYLRTGRIRAKVTPPRGMPIGFSVRSPVLTASVRGTSFEFDGTYLWVDDGRVVLAGSSGQKVYVAEGQRSYVDGNNQNRIAQTEEKSSEITAIPALLEALDIAGCIVTIDAAD